MRFKSEGQLREYWEIERQNARHEFMEKAKKQGRNETDEEVKQFIDLWENLLLKNELEAVCQLFREENIYRTDIEVSRHFERDLKPIGELMWNR